MMMRSLISCLFALWGAVALAEGHGAGRPVLRVMPEPVVLPAHIGQLRPLARDEYLPRTRWETLPGTAIWTRAALAALKADGAGMVAATPKDIAQWCPAYASAPTPQRRAFWVGLMSALAKHESTFRPRVSGDSGKSHGLLQIRTPTARAYKCAVSSRAALHQPTNNLACAVRIMNRTVVRDNAVGLRDGRWRGVAADWGPFTTRRKREDMRAWVREQPYCKSRASLRPVLRPAGLGG